MRVLVTGGTGFVGGWSAAALRRAGHDVRFLVRNRERLDPVAALGVVTTDHVVGDVTDPAAVHSALEGCDAVLHCAAMVATDPRRDAEVQATNLTGAETVLGTAVALGLDPVVHTSSITAVFTPGVTELRSDLPTGRVRDAYGVSKSAVEDYARGLQADGHPVTITYPGMVVGPGVGSRFGEVAEGFETILQTHIVPGSAAGWLVVDVRDLAAIHAAVMVPGAGPRRYMAGGTHLDAGRLTALFREVTGNRILRIPMPGVGLRLAGSVVDMVTGLTGWTTPLTRAAMDYYTQMPASDDTAVRDELGVTYRDVAETFRDCVASLAATGRITPAQAGEAGRASAGEQHR
ncbi:MAG TPA: NAD-dependent epimerase/dehydratase family protein [Acidimicrobiales bacterium]|nr:NAD-dependent epimerase/dehydratase family protein [Acidimicrobiales bacterium]